MKNLEVVNADIVDPSEEDKEYLISSPKLHTLIYSSNNIDLSFLEKATSIKKLHLVDSIFCHSRCDISVLKKMPNLTQVRFAQTPSQIDVISFLINKGVSVIT